MAFSSINLRSASLKLRSTIRLSKWGENSNSQDHHSGHSTIVASAQESTPIFTFLPFSSIREILYPAPARNAPPCRNGTRIGSQASDHPRQKAHRAVDALTARED